MPALQEMHTKNGSIQQYIPARYSSTAPIPPTEDWLVTVAVPVDDGREPGERELVGKIAGTLLEDWATGLEYPLLLGRREDWDEEATEEEAGREEAAESEAGVEELAIALLDKGATVAAVLARPVPDAESLFRAIIIPTPPI